MGGASAPQPRSTEMSTKSIEHKQMLVAKCYELALMELPHIMRESEIYNNAEDLTVDDHAMRYLDKITSVARGEVEFAGAFHHVTRQKVADSLDKLTSKPKGERT